MTSLLSPKDATNENVSSDMNAPSLSDEETKLAKDDLENRVYAEAYPKVERRFADPLIPGQKFCLHSFVPSSGATPDEDGIYGMIKIRGVYDTLQEASERSEDLIRNHDSYHKIFIGKVGRPMPATEESTWSHEVEEIDIQKSVSKILSEDVKAKRLEEKKKVDEIREREQNLRESVEQEATDPYEKYTCLRVKKAQIIWGYMEHRKKLNEMLDVFEKTLKEVEEMDEEDEDYSKRYLARYNEAREKAGIPEDKHDVSFMKYLDTNVTDLELFAKEQDILEEERKDDPDFKSSRVAGSTITVRHREHKVPEGEVDSSILEKSEQEIIEDLSAKKHPLQIQTKSEES